MVYILVVHVHGCSTLFHTQAGYFSNVSATACAACPAGTFSSTVQASACSACQPGFASQTVAAGRADTCLECIAGKYATLAGSTFCSACAPGSFSQNASANCTMCPVGTFSIAYGPMQWQDGDWVLSRRTVSRENDLNSDASIDLSEFMDAFGGSVWTGAQVEALFTQMDINDNGRLSLDADLITPAELSASWHYTVGLTTRTLTNGAKIIGVRVCAYLRVSVRVQGSCRFAFAKHLCVSISVCACVCARASSRHHHCRLPHVSRRRLFRRARRPAIRICNIHQRDAADSRPFARPARQSRAGRCCLGCCL